MLTCRQAGQVESESIPSLDPFESPRPQPNLLSLNPNDLVCVAQPLTRTSKSKSPARNANRLFIALQLKLSSSQSGRFRQHIAGTLSRPTPPFPGTLNYPLFRTIRACVCTTVNKFDLGSRSSWIDSLVTSRTRGPRGSGDRCTVSV